MCIRLTVISSGWLGRGHGLLGGQWNGRAGAIPRAVGGGRQAVTQAAAPARGLEVGLVAVDVGQAVGARLADLRGEALGAIGEAARQSLRGLGPDAVVQGQVRVQGLEQSYDFSTLLPRQAAHGAQPSQGGATVCRGATTPRMWGAASVPAKVTGLKAGSCEQRKFCEWPGLEARRTQYTLPVVCKSFPSLGSPNGAIARKTKPSISFIHSHATHYAQKDLNILWHQCQGGRWNSDRRPSNYPRRHNPNPNITICRILS